jgi:hypothetical protein
VFVVYSCCWLSSAQSFSGPSHTELITTFYCLISHCLTSQSESESESKLCYDWRFIANQFVLATSPLKPTTSNFIFQLNTYGYSPYVTSSLTRGWVVRLQLLLVPSSAVILGSESRGTHNHILLPKIRDFPNLEGQAPVFISPRNRVARLYPQALGSLSIASYDSQEYGGSIRPRFHTPSLCSFGTDRIQNTASSSSFIVVCVSATTDICL